MQVTALLESIISHDHFNFVHGIIVMVVLLEILTRLSQ